MVGYSLFRPSSGYQVTGFSGAHNASLGILIFVSASFSDEIGRKRGQSRPQKRGNNFEWSQARYGQGVPGPP